MKGDPLVWGAVLLFVLAPHGHAQQKPDFSGAWTQISATLGTGADERSTQPPPTPDIGSGWGQTITLKQAEDTLTVEYLFFRPGDLQPPMKHSFALDGSETRDTVMMGRGIQERISRSTWQADTLVIRSLYEIDEADLGQVEGSEVTRRLWLQPPTSLWDVESPPSLVIETTRGGVLGGRSTTIRTVYRKL
jgi:hypothetical protein